jgi:hypothetical protein
LPLVALSLNALRVRNCDYLSGLAWFVVLPLLSAACASAAGVTVGLLAPTRRRLTATVLAVAVVFGSLLWGGYRFYVEPPIFAYDPFAGYFAGSLYDEEVRIAAPLLWARAYHFAVASAALSACALFLDGRKLALSLRAARGRLPLAGLTLLFSLIALGLHHDRARLGFQRDTAQLARALGAERVTPHFVLHYSPRGPFAKDIDRYAADAEFRYAELHQLLGVAPLGRVDAFLFDSAAQKGALMGAAHTSIATPWRRQIYLQADGWPHPVLMHELAHVFMGRFGDSIFGVSRCGLAFNVGLIEGAAVAASWDGTPSELTPDQQVKAMREAHIAPPLGRVMSLDFLGLSAAQAYAEAGSFCRFLLERDGPKTFGALFHAAGDARAYPRLYHKSFAALEAEWSKQIDAVRLPADEAALARERLSRPGVFHRVCAHELALRRQAAQEALATGDSARALQLLRSVCADDPDEPQNRVAVMDTAYAAGDRAATRSAALLLIDDPKLDSTLRSRAQAMLGDLALTSGDRAGAAAHYRAALSLPLAEDAARLVTAKRIAAEEPPGPIADGLSRYLVPPKGHRDDALDLLDLSELVRAAPDRGLFHYLFGLRLAAHDQPARSAAELTLSLSSARALPDARFRRAALRQLGRARFLDGDLAGARAAFAELAKDPRPSVRREATDFIARIAAALTARPVGGRSEPR